jgi:type II secretory pathway pseudopilin PulG
LTKKQKTIAWGAALFLAGSLLALLKFRPAPVDERQGLTLERRIELACDLAHDKFANTLHYLAATTGVGTEYPYTTYQPVFSFRDWLRQWQKKQRQLPEGVWLTADSGSWAAGAFPALLWKMPDCESDPALKKYWVNQAKSWAEPLREAAASKKDIALNNLFVFRPWFEMAAGQERNRQLETLLQGARTLAMPYRKGKGTFHEGIGVMGYEVTARRTDGKVHWQAFIDHSINVEQLLWAAAHNPNPVEANDWRKKAVRHLKTVAANSGERRRPGKGGTWQRGYFDEDPNSPSYGKFLFNEGKQGWTDGSTWSRGQAWFIYGSSIAYQYSGDAEIRQIAKSAIDYFLAHLPDRFAGRQRRPGDFVPPWDFDYALSQDPDTERDSSAAAIAVSGILKLVSALPPTDPDRLRYWRELENILSNLTNSAYLPGKEAPEMSLLQGGCYHHPKAIVPSHDCGSGLIWGDYFFLDALLDYRRLAKVLQ